MGGGDGLDVFVGEGEEGGGGEVLAGVGGTAEGEEFGEGEADAIITVQIFTQKPNKKKKVLKHFHHYFANQ